MDGMKNDGKGEFEREFMSRQGTIVNWLWGVKMFGISYIFMVHLDWILKPGECYNIHI